MNKSFSYGGWEAVDRRETGVVTADVSLVSIGRFLENAPRFVVCPLMALVTTASTLSMKKLWTSADRTDTQTDPNTDRT